MGKMLDAAAVGQFHRDGFYAPVRVASREEAWRMRGRLEAYEAEHGGPLKGSVRFKCATGVPLRRVAEIFFPHGVVGGFNTVLNSVWQPAARMMRD